MSSDPCNHYLKIQKSIGIWTPKMRAHLEVWGFIPSHSFTLIGARNVTLGPHFWLASLQALALIMSPRLRLQHIVYTCKGGTCKKTTVATLILGSQPKQVLVKMQAKSEAREITFHALGNGGDYEVMNLHTLKWGLILGVGVLMNSQIFKGRLYSQNSLDWMILSTIEKFLEPAFLKWACRTHLDI